MNPMHEKEKTGAGLFTASPGSMLPQIYHNVPLAHLVRVQVGVAVVEPDDQPQCNLRGRKRRMGEDEPGMTEGGGG